jgi:hypothetical protein
MMRLLHVTEWGLDIANCQCKILLVRSKTPFWITRGRNVSITVSVVKDLLPRLHIGTEFPDREQPAEVPEGPTQLS